MSMAENFTQSAQGKHHLLLEIYHCWNQLTEEVSTCWVQGIKGMPFPLTLWVQFSADDIQKYFSLFFQK